MIIGIKLGTYYHKMNNIYNIKINIKTIHYQTFLKFKYFITQFCTLYNIQFHIQNCKKTYNKFSLLKSPHIHKKTWRAYKKINFNYYIILKNLNFNFIKKLNFLIKILNNNSYLKFYYIK
jgi:ribosomal protein S10